MEETNNKKKKVITIVISIIIILILALAISYAYFSTQLSGSDQIVKVGELELVLDETSEGITLDNAIGISDSEGINSTPSTFELRNNGNKAVDYTIYLDDNTISDTDTRIDDKYLKYNLNKNDADSGATLLTRIGANPNRILDSGTIEGGGTNKYSLNLWITDEVNGNYSGQVFSGKLRVEVSQERPTVAEVLLADSSNNINTDDPDQTFITGSNPNNYIWYSGKLWRAVSIDPSDNSVKLVTEENISVIPYDDNSSAFEGSYMAMWLNDTTVDGFLGNLRNPESFIKMDSKWNVSQMSDTSKPSNESEGGTIVEDPVGLLNIYEYTMCGSSNGYLNSGLYWYTITPFDSSTKVYIIYDNVLNSEVTSGMHGIRPSINLKSEIKIVSGDGTEENPYRLMGDNDTNLNGTKLNTRYSGEYVSFGTGENNLYRIVSHETDGLTKVTTVDLIYNDTTIAFDLNRSPYYSKETTIGQILNGEYLESGVYLTSEQVEMIEESSIWYRGRVALGDGYYLSKYTDETMNVLISNTTEAKVGLLRIGEQMLTPLDYYWTITIRDVTSWSTTINVILPEGTGNYRAAVNPGRIRPALNLKSNVIITGGDGTLQNPFQIELAS